jgi:cobalt-zinc-cadmium efflux system outer membrane protein
VTAVGTLDPRAPLPSRDEARAQALGRGDVLALRTQAERQDLLARAAARRAIPEPTVLAGRKTTTAGDIQDQGPIFGVSLTIPLFDRGQGARAVAEVEATLLRARQQALESRLAAEAMAAVTNAEARREAEATYGPASDPDALVRIASGAYEEGEMRILELLDAYRTALAARVRIIELRLEARRAEITVDVATGVERLR